MATQMTRAEKAGRKMGNAIAEMVNLMYQNNTALHFYRGLFMIVNRDLTRRSTKDYKEKNK